MSGPEYINTNLSFPGYSVFLDEMEIGEPPEKSDMFSHQEMEIESDLTNSKMRSPIAEPLQQTGIKKRLEVDIGTKDSHRFSKKLRIQGDKAPSPLTLKDMPKDILRIIFEFLPGKAYFSAELVCHNFRDVTSEYDIIVNRVNKGTLHGLEGVGRKLQFYGPMISHLNLKKLFLNTHHFKYGDVETLVRSCQNLKTLEISNCTIDCQLFVSINALSNLEVLTFENVVFKSTVKLSQLSQTLKKLNTLVLENFKCESNSVMLTNMLREDDLNFLLDHSGLVRLAIKNHTFGLGIKPLTPFSNQKVQILELDGCTLTSDLLNNLIKKCDKLETLNLNFIEVKGDFQIEEIKKKESLTNLNYSPSTKVNPVKRVLF